MKFELGSIRRWVPAALLGVVLLGGASAWAADGAERKDLIVKGDAVCTRCHDETEPFPVLAIGKTRHGTAADGGIPTCTSCHGDSPTHISKPEGATVRPAPEVHFARDSKTPIAVQDQVCLNCHQGDKLTHWQTGLHAAREVPCIGCHQLHTQHDKARDKKTQPEVCFACHKEQRMMVNRPSHHPIKEGKVVCSDCHNSHGSTGERMLVRDTVVQTCYTCHMEKRGPFVRNHQPVTEDCTICHNPHGSVNDNLLKQRPPFLCQQCHEPTGHRGANPSFTGTPGETSGTGTSGLGITQGRACLNCHTNIHGSNNPFNDTTAGRALRR